MDVNQKKKTLQLGPILGLTFWDDVKFWPDEGEEEEKKDIRNISTSPVENKRTHTQNTILSLYLSLVLYT